MRDILPTLREWIGASRPFALGTVVATRKSAPREPGAAMALSPDDEVLGSVSGGCVEGAVVELGRELLDTGGARIATFGYSDEEAFAVGLTCGGEIDILVERIDPGEQPFMGDVIASIEEEEPVAVATVTEGGAPGAKLAVWPDRTAGSLGTEGLDVAVTDDARGMLDQGVTGVRRYGSSGERRVDDVSVFVASYQPPPQLIVFGAIDFAAAVARIGSFLGFRVTVCDAREVFATEKRFPDADEVVVEWPHRYLAEVDVDPRTVICVLTHDPKFDVPVLEVALRTDAAYIGAMGSRRTHEERLVRLREAGLTENEMARLRSPIGLDIGARTPEEVAVAVAAEIVADRWGGSGLPLGDTEGRIHDSARDRVRAGRP
ncbi:MAG: XdhC/CoxI family protein [Nitriliruptorales bacterium]|nr:XdhC/CoxI family protein [Nitriliruptorales bacterium]